MPSSSTDVNKTDENIPTSTQTQLLKRTPLDLSYLPINSNASEGDLAAEVSSSLLEIPLNPVTPFSIRGILSARSAATPSMFATLSKARPVLPTPSPIYGLFYLPDGNNLTFRQLATGQWRATVQDWLRRAEEMPVVCKGNVAAMLSELQGARTIDVRSRIHILEPVQEAKCIYVGALSVRGGGKNKKNGKRDQRRIKKQNRPTSTLDKTTSNTESLGRDSIPHRLSSMVASAKNPENEVYKALEILRGYYNDNGFNASMPEEQTLYKRNEVVKDINNTSLDIIWALCEGGIQGNIDNLLSTLLQTNNNYLAARTQNIEDWIAERENSYSPIPTCSYLFKVFHRGKDSEKVDKLELASERIRQRFQLINAVIVHLFHAKLAKVAAGEEVVWEKETEQLIEKSKHLHALLAGGDFVGDVDDFIPSFSGASSLLQSIYPDPTAEIKPADVLKEIISLRKVRNWLKIYNKTHKKNDNGNYDYDPEHPSMSILQWYRQEISPKQRDIRLDTLDEKMHLRDLVKYIMLLSREEVLNDAYNVHFEYNLKADAKEGGGSWLSAFLQKFEAYYNKQQDFGQDESFFENEKSISSDEDKVAPEENLASNRSSDSSTTVHQRSAHAGKQTEAPATIQVASLLLTNSTQKIWEKLFDTNYKVSSKITYHGYELLWNRLFGEIGNKVGSHRQLLDQQGHFWGL